MRLSAMTGTALLLSMALLSQGIRMIVPVSPAISMFIVGTLVGACTLFATFRYGFVYGLFIACITPWVAFMQGMLVYLPFVPVVALGSSLFVLTAYIMEKKSFYLAAIVSPLVKAVSMYGGFVMLFSFFAVPETVKKAILFTMSWPQLVTGYLAFLLVAIVMRRLR